MLTKMKKTGQKLLSVFLLVCMLAPFMGQISTVAAEKYYIYINKGTNVVTVYDTATKEPVVAFTCSVGSGNNTPDGDFKLGTKYVWHELMGPSYGQYCTRITTGVLFHPVWYYVNGNKATQSTVQYNKLGQVASHGCVRLTAAAAIWIYDNCPSGTSVHIFRGTESDDPLGKPKTIQVSTATRYGWDPTDPDPANPYETGSSVPKITVSSTIIEYGSKFKNNNMTAVDSCGFDCTSWVKAEGKVNTKKLGEYKVKYTVLDSCGRSAEKTVKYQVVEPDVPILSGVKEKLTLEYNTKRKMLNGVSSRSFLGSKIDNSKIRIYVMAPGETSYHKLSSTTYKFASTGKYNIKYAVKDPNNGLQSIKYQTVRVVDSKAPKHTSESDWEDMELYNDVKSISFDELLGDEKATLRCGEDRTDKLSIRIKDEDGNYVAEVTKGESFTPTGKDFYVLEYCGSSAIKNLKTGEFEYSYASRDLYLYEPESPKNVTETTDETAAEENGENAGSTENTDSNDASSSGDPAANADETASGQESGNVSTLSVMDYEMRTF